MPPPPKLFVRLAAFPNLLKKANDLLDNLTLHPVLGYVAFVLTMAAILVFISFFGSWMTNQITHIFESFNPHATGIIGFNSVERRCGRFICRTLSGPGVYPALLFDSGLAG